MRKQTYPNSISNSLSEPKSEEEDAEQEYKTADSKLHINYMDASNMSKPQKLDTDCKIDITDSTCQIQSEELSEFNSYLP
jgi:ethanolamine utilization protein EutQ (cupin superfamily)